MQLVTLANLLESIKLSSSLLTFGAVPGQTFSAYEVMENTGRWPAYPHGRGKTRAE